MVKNFEDMFIRFDSFLTDGQTQTRTDRHRMTT